MVTVRRRGARIGEKSPTCKTTRWHSCPFICGPVSSMVSSWEQTSHLTVQVIRDSLVWSSHVRISEEAPAMKVALTGATGFIGSHVLTDLDKHGHEVLALVRNDDQADSVAARGAAPTVVDLYDRPAVLQVLSKADGVIHTASPGDTNSANLDSAVVDAAME